MIFIYGIGLYSLTLMEMDHKYLECEIWNVMTNG
jgi:hypothetical protein